MPTIDEYFKTAKAHDKAGEHKQAIACYQQVLACNPNDVSALFAIGRDFSALKHWDKAVKYYKQVIKQQPGFCSLINNSLYFWS